MQYVDVFGTGNQLQRKQNKKGFVPLECCNDDWILSKGEWLNSDRLHSLISKNKLRLNVSDCLLLITLKPLYLCVHYKHKMWFIKDSDRFQCTDRVWEI